MQLTVNSLTIGYSATAVQSDLQLSAHSGEMICILGKNGCGKSTLLRTLAGLQPALQGSIILSHDGITADISTLSNAERARLLSLVLTQRLSIDNTTVHDVVAMGRYPYSSFLGGLTQDDEQHISSALQQVNIADKTHSFFNRLSDGEKQRVLIAKALAQQTPLILLDEPTSHLDLNNRIHILLLLRQLAHLTNRCVIISTHELDLALQMADTIWLMSPHNSGIQKAAPEALIASGAFQNAFQDDNFSFDSQNGQLRVVLTGNL